MTPKTPAMLLVLVETARLRWFVAAVGHGGRIMPLLRSEDGDLAKYQELPFDDQVAFLRHRFCGVLQKGCDRLWARDCKASQFVIVFEGLLPDPSGELTRSAAEHFATWMLNPPAIVFNHPGANSQLELVAGEADPSVAADLLSHLRSLMPIRDDPDAWELSPRKA